MEPIYWKLTTTLLGFIEKDGKTWFAYVIEDNATGDTCGEACFSKKYDAVAYVKREYQRLHGKFGRSEIVSKEAMEMRKQYLNQIEAALEAKDAEIAALKAEIQYLKKI